MPQSKHSHHLILCHCAVVTAVLQCHIPWKEFLCRAGSWIIPVGPFQLGIFCDRKENKTGWLIPVRAGLWFISFIFFFYNAFCYKYFLECLVEGFSLIFIPKIFGCPLSFISYNQWSQLEFVLKSLLYRDLWVLFNTCHSVGKTDLKKKNKSLR